MWVGITLVESSKLSEMNTKGGLWGHISFRFINRLHRNSIYKNFHRKCQNLWKSWTFPNEFKMSSSNAI